MRCKACNNEMEVRFYEPEVEDGAKPTGPILEDLCPGCLMIVRAQLYGADGPDNEIENLTHALGLSNVLYSTD